MTKKTTPSFITQLLKQLLKNITQTIKSVLTFQPSQTIPNFLSSIASLKQNSLTQKFHDISKGDASPIQQIRTILSKKPANHI